MARKRCTLPVGVTVLALAWITATAATPPESAHPRREVLPAGVVPVHYDLLLAPDAEALTFSGKVAITIEVASATSAITLNAVGLVFDHARIDEGPEPQVSFDKALGQATLAFADAIPKGRHVLAIEYHGTIARTTLGFFAMDYSGTDGPRRTLATNLEPTNARDLLPCWDEPARKATFSVSVDVPANRMAVSNMPIERVTPLSPSMQRVRFAQSPKMSTYLLYLGIGDFERIQQKVDGVDVGVVVRRGDTAKAGYALEQAARLLHYYNDYFGFPYPLPKLDLIAAPGEIEGGSMENWGAIFYSQNHLLFDPVTSTEADRQLVFRVVAHEMSHQWFGDLVTMAWWDDLWLNEGFASWMTIYASDDLHPEWEIGLQAARTFERGKQADSLPSTHPVVQEIDTADQALQSFDEITYDKGAAIITMINAYVGRERFRDGVRHYMRAHAFGNTVDADLWRPLQDAAGLPITGIAEDFTHQEGLPLVRVTRGERGVALQESRFADDPATISKLPPQHWRLPLAVGGIDAPATYQLLQGSAELAVAAPLLVNAGQLGYARVLYSGELFSALPPRVPALKPADQLGLLNDAWAFATAHYAPASELLQLAAQLPATANPLVWERLIVMLEALDRYYGGQPGQAGYRRFALGLLAPLAARLGPGGDAREPANIEILRGDARELQARLGNAEVVAAARARLDAGSGGPAEQRTALDIVAATADPKTFEALLLRARQATDPLQKLHLYEALTGVSDPALARRMVDTALSDQVPAGSGASLIEQLAERHPDVVWSALAPRLDDPQLPLTKDERWFVVTGTARQSALPERITDVEAYVEKHVPPDARRPFLGAIADIRRNQRIVTQMLPEIDRWVSTQPAPTPPR